MISSAVVSLDQLYRYDLQRSWATAGIGRAVAFIGLNPSTADAMVDDATIRVCAGYARRWGYERLVMRNLFGFRATEPVALLQADDPVGPEGDEWLTGRWEQVGLVVACWGNGGLLQGRGRQVRSMMNDAGVLLHVLGLTKGKQPVHPLRQRRELTPRHWAYVP